MQRDAVHEITFVVKVNKLIKLVVVPGNGDHHHLRKQGVPVPVYPQGGQSWPGIRVPFSKQPIDGMAQHPRCQEIGKNLILASLDIHLHRHSRRLFQSFLGAKWFFWDVSLVNVVFQPRFESDHRHFYRFRLILVVVYRTKAPVIMGKVISALMIKCECSISITHAGRYGMVAYPHCTVSFLELLVPLLMRGIGLKGKHANISRISHVRIAKVFREDGRRRIAEIGILIRLVNEPSVNANVGTYVQEDVIASVAEIFLFSGKPMPLLRLFYAFVGLFVDCVASVEGLMR